MADLTVGEISTQRRQIYVEWKIEKFFNLPQKADTCYQSPPFSCLGLSWCFVVYPNGQRNQQSIDFVGLYLKRIDDTTKSICVDFRIGFKSVNGLYKNIQKSHYFVNHEEFGWPCLTDRHELWRKKRMHQSGLTAFCILGLTNAPNDVSSEQITDGIRALSEDFRSLLTNEYKSDVVVKAQDKRFQAHKLVLATRSRVFAAMFEHTMKENCTGEVDMVDCEPGVVQSFLAFLYSGKIENLTMNTVFSLLSLAEQYDLPALKAECFSFIETNLNLEIVCDALDVAYKHDNVELKNEAIELLSSNLKEVMQSSRWIKFLVENPVLATEILTNAIPT